jgi:transposase-like protein
MRTIKNVTDDFRMQIIQEYLTGVSKGFLKRKYNLSEPSVITYWMRNFGIEDPNKNSIPINFMPKKKEESLMVADLQKQISQLKASLAHSKMKNEALETMINLAEKEFQIQIRKKSGTKQ